MPAVPGEGRSRRDFLKAAVIGSAAVATVGGAAAAGYALTSRKPSTVRFVGNEVSGDPCRACLEDTMFHQQSTFEIEGSGEASPGSWYLWFTDHALPTGHYTVAVTVRKFAVNGGSTFTDYTIGGAGSPFVYQSGAGDVQIFSVTTGLDCPTDLPGSPVDTFNTLADAANFLWTESGANDMQMAIHMKYDKTIGVIGVAGTTEKIEFIVTITAQGQVAPLCTETATVTATQK
jgi:hypothetical protein